MWLKQERLRRNELTLLVSASDVFVDMDRKFEIVDTGHVLVLNRRKFCRTNTAVFGINK